MKNFYKLLGIIALAAVIGFGMMACRGDGGDDEEKKPNPQTPDSSEFALLQGNWKNGSSYMVLYFPPETGSYVGKLGQGKATINITGNKLVMKASEDFTNSNETETYLAKDATIIEATLTALADSNETSNGTIYTYDLVDSDGVELTLTLSENWIGILQITGIKVKDATKTDYIIRDSKRFDEIT